MRTIQDPSTPTDLDTLIDFLTRAEEDASDRAGDFFDGTPLTAAFADAEWKLIAALRRLVVTDEEARAFVRHWRARVETASAEEYPQRHGTAVAGDDGTTWAMGAQRLRAAVTLWDALVRDEVVERYRKLGMVAED